MLNVKEKSSTGTLSELYHTDYYTWAMTNAELLKKGKFNEVDYINLAEEVKDLGLSEYKELRSYLANLLSRLYKWDNQPELRTNSWKNTIANSINEISLNLKDNPGLKYEPVFNEAFSDGWNKARYIISNDMDINIKLISSEYPYSFNEIIKKASGIAPDRIDESDISFLNNIF
ncbi:MAG: DUF29 domain-containing protein [Candidatus Acididesulfobacter diazotrophicus]|jgi:hypothetical protein|uniref:DUF29 domain-containing protein n=1 Tax=Candidatus Acididesulfobacter diazotrophicus TaxID=2597226 RepID=A0A519BLM7_9DELT|nr:MAG: DUF29 domain-containing protein [Candidatus Acididesulfobacter diazotrophicus]